MNCVINKRIAIKIIIVALVSFLLSVLIKHEVLSLSSISPIQKLSDFKSSDLYSATLYRSPIHRRNANIVILSTDNCDRNDLLHCLETVVDYNPALIALDVIFEHPQANDSLLISFFNENNIIYSVYLYDFTSNNDASQMEECYFYTELKNYKYGAINLPTISSNVIRDFQSQYILNEVNIVNSFAFEVVKNYSPKKLKNHNVESLIPISYSNTDFDEISCKELLCASKAPHEMTNLFKDRIVLVGATSDPGDYFLTPIDNNYPGVKIHAHIVDTILNDNYISNINVWIYGIFSFIICVIFVFVQEIVKVAVSDFNGIIMRIVQMIILLLLYLIGVYLYSENIYLNCSLPILTIIFSNIVADIYAGIENFIIKYVKLWIVRLKK